MVRFYTRGKVALGVRGGMTIHSCNAFTRVFDSDHSHKNGIVQPEVDIFGALIL
jgi:hypothetical protein